MKKIDELIAKAAQDANYNDTYSMTPMTKVHPNFAETLIKLVLEEVNSISLGIEDHYYNLQRSSSDFGYKNECAAGQASQRELRTRINRILEKK